MREKGPRQGRGTLQDLPDRDAVDDEPGRASAGVGTGSDRTRRAAKL